MLGIGLRLLVDNLHLKTLNFLSILPALGTMGLILIVFEGALELKYEKEKNKVIRGAFFSAFFTLLITVTAITFIIYQIAGGSLYLCFVNAIPFGVISSAVAIPSVTGLQKKTREFIIYESSFSDIVGIIFFNFAISNTHISLSSFTALALDTSLVLICSAVACLCLIYLMGRIKHRIKFFLIIAILILVYAVGQSFHLASLILILSFGLFLNNANAIRHAWFRSVFIYQNLTNDLTQLGQLSAESAFILRTFFFVIFGFTMDLYALNNKIIIANGLIVLAGIYLIRYLYLYTFRPENLYPEIFVTPRGLISILLYYNLPENMKIPSIGTSFLFMAILGTSIVMSIGLITAKKKASTETGVFD